MPTPASPTPPSAPPSSSASGPPTRAPGLSTRRWPTSRFLARNSLLGFTQHIWPWYRPAAHHRLIADTLDRVERGEIRRLIISVPPQHGKSQLASIAFPAYYLGRNPDKHVLACSYGQEFVEGFSRQARNILLSEEYQEVFTPRLAGDSKAVDRWLLAAPHRGGYRCAGVGGGVTGKPAHLLLIDDPVKDQKWADSETILSWIDEWYRTAAYTRLQPDGAVVLIMTRWCDEDLAGRLLGAAHDDARADQWTELRLPALAEEDDPLDRAPGEALWAEHFTAEVLAGRARTLGARFFAALYQQRPAPAEGHIWKAAWFKTYDDDARLPPFMFIVQAWDTALKDTDTSDTSASVTMGLTHDNQIYLLDLFWDRLTFPALLRAMKDRYELVRLRTGTAPHEIAIEDKVSGTSAFQTLSTETTLPVVAVGVEGNKIVRARAVTPYYEAGRVWHPRHHPEREAYELLLCRFPTAKVKDPVDATSLCVARLMASPDPGQPLGA